MWRLALLAGALVAAFAAAAAAGAVPPGLGSVLGGRKVVRAEVVVVQKGVVHDYRIDRGRILSVAPGNVVLAELDGTAQTVPLDGSVAVTLNGQPSTLSALRRGMQATTIRDGDAGATTLDATAAAAAGGKGRVRG